MGKRISIAFASVFALIVFISMFWHSHGYAHTIHIKQVKAPVISFIDSSQDITPSNPCCLYQKGKVPVDCRYVIRIKALNDYSSNGNSAIDTHHFFLELSSFITPFKKQFTLYQQHICTVLCAPSQLRGPPSINC